VKRSPDRVRDARQARTGVSRFTPGCRFGPARQHARNVGNRETCGALRLGPRGLRSSARRQREPRRAAAFHVLHRADVSRMGGPPRTRHACEPGGTRATRRIAAAPTRGGWQRRWAWRRPAGPHTRRLAEALGLAAPGGARHAALLAAERRRDLCLATPTRCVSAPRRGGGRARCPRSKSRRLRGP
jgi:hypothetical protein